MAQVQPSDLKGFAYSFRGLPFVKAPAKTALNDTMKGMGLSAKGLPFMSNYESAAPAIDRRGFFGMLIQFWANN